MSRTGRVRLVRVGVIVGGIVLLEACCRAGLINPLSVIPPSAMAATMFDLVASGSLNADILQTFGTVLAAYVVSVVAGVVVGAVVHAVPRLRRAVDPLLASYYSVPVFIFYPLLVALFGLNVLPLMVIGALFAMPAMVIATVSGLDRVPGVLYRVARMHRLGRLRAVMLVTLPAAMPQLFGGLKLALAYAFIGVIAGEFIMSGGGLGYAISYAYESFDNRTMYGVMLFVLLVSSGTNGLLFAWEQHFNRRRGR
jgi:NitT/TauT family transport system permease protein